MISNEPIVTTELAVAHGLTEDEYEKILKLLGRTPTYTELGIYSVMWSEHCSYKNSIALIKTLPRSGKRLLVGAGEENAGLVDIGDNLAVAFKIESHNHPSAVEPYQGAATGIGGILRDVFTMGARPIAALDSLRFGTLDNARTRYLFKNVVRGIGDYGNSFGVPTVAGEVYFEKCYQDNPLVNAMAVGIVKHNEVASAIAKGKGNPVFIVGSSTGRDGIHGATFASEEISEASEAKRPSVQVGDPFTEKLLLEATLEIIRSGLIVGIQDMGAAGITCSTTEMSAKGKSGMIIDLDRVPVREQGMSAYEIMLSESQERMLVVGKKGSEDAIRNVFKKWDLHSVVVGEVIAEDRVKIFHHGQLKADVPANSLVLGGGAPVYQRETRRPKYLDEVHSFNPAGLMEVKDLNEIILKLLASPNIAAKQWIYEQYDHMVRTNTTILPGSDAAVIRIKGTEKSLVLKTDCNGRYVYLNPRKGAQIAVAESARNVVCSGGTPLAITNCLNFGNPYKPEMYWQFKEAVAGIGEACRVFETPVTGGNVSFYNESPDFSIFPTPVIGMLGLIENRQALTMGFKQQRNIVALLGTTRADISGSEYLQIVHDLCAGDAPYIDLAEEKSLHSCAIELIHRDLIVSAHDISDGGIAVALAEMCIFSEHSLSCSSVLPDEKMRPDFVLFGEEQSRILIEASIEHLDVIKAICLKHRIPLTILGSVTKNPTMQIGKFVDIEVSALEKAYLNSIREKMSI